MKIIDGWLSGARKVLSPNFNDRPDSNVSLLVIHNISLPPGQFGSRHVEDFFQNKLDSSEHPYFEGIKELEVSSHFFIRRNGEVVQFVSCEDRAWHAGASEFCGEENCNDFGVGIELEGTDDIPYTDEQYEQLSLLTSEIMRQYPKITPDRIVGHADIAPERKTDPGPSFDWQRFRKSLDSIY